MRRIRAGKAAGASALSLTRGGAGCAVGWDWPGAGSGGEASPSASLPPRPPRASDEAACLVEGCAAPGKAGAPRAARTRGT